MTTTELKSIAEDAEKWRQHQKRIISMMGWTAEQWATALEWYQPHTSIAPATTAEAATIMSAYRKRFGRDPSPVASTMFDYIAIEHGRVFTPWYARP